jgi:hypothetical protein
MAEEAEETLDALRRTLTEGRVRLRRSRATLAQTEALLGREVANDNEAGGAGGARAPDAAGTPGPDDAAQP